MLHTCCKTPAICLRCQNTKPSSRVEIPSNIILKKVGPRFWSTSIHTFSASHILTPSCSSVPCRRVWARISMHRLREELEPINGCKSVLGHLRGWHHAWHRLLPELLLPPRGVALSHWYLCFREFHGRCLWRFASHWAIIDTTLGRGCYAYL